MVDENKKLYIAALVIILGGNATGFVNAINPHFRADSFTSLDAAKQKAYIIKRIKECRDADEENMDKLRHRITVNERDINYIWKQLTN